ncbi:MAG TPA: acyl-CoA desaturase [Anaeromyxobacter sp.]|nr:acyl-CoA desaturase [Anaeromyxobacter sp.]
MFRSARSDRIQWLKSVPFLAVHAVAAATPLVAPFAWRWAALAAALYAVRMFAITAGYHRYFSHRAYRTSRAFQLLLAVAGTTAVQKGPLWWAAHHRDHHRFSDLPEDVHSPLQRGFWWSHVGWILSERHDRTRLDRVRDLARYPELVWLDRWHLVPPLALAAALLAVAGVPALLWGFFVSTVALWHGTFAINSVAHVLGRRRYATPDGSRNGLALALLTFGEGWHNNHHFFPGSARQGFLWWEVDLSYYALRVLAAAGVVQDLRSPPARVRLARGEADARAERAVQA